MESRAFLWRGWLLSWKKFLKTWGSISLRLTMVRWYMGKKERELHWHKKRISIYNYRTSLFFFFWLVYKTRMDDATCLSDGCLFPCVFFVCYWYQNDILYLNQDKHSWMGFFFIFEGRFFLGLCNYISGGGCNLIRQFERDETFDLIWILWW